MYLVGETIENNREKSVSPREKYSVVFHLHIKGISVAVPMMPILMAAP
jgi:hypothetical protein